MISRMPTHSTRQLFSQNGTGADSVQPDLYRGKLPSGLECPTWTGHRRLLPCGHPHQLQLGLHQRPWARHSRPSPDRAQIRQVPQSADQQQKQKLLLGQVHSELVRASCPQHTSEHCHSGPRSARIFYLFSHSPVTPNLLSLS